MNNINEIVENVVNSFPNNTTKPCKVQVCYLLNNDNSVRWIWNAKTSSPIFLKFYSATNFKSSLFVYVIRLIYLLGVEKFSFKTKKITLNSTPQNFNIHDDWGLFTGTIGPNNKMFLYTNEVFYKIASTGLSIENLKNEVRNIQFLKA